MVSALTQRLPDGRLVTTTNQVIGLATGQHYQDAEGQWRDTRAEILPLGEGVVAAPGPTRAAFYNWHPTLLNQ
ncbi:MAG: hypothetical protein IPM17_17265 [Verrucomicrobia bacterium]|nr:hypothetical protein [Verrucomicrobiota bacterium]